MVSRGVGQGCSLSPLLYILVAETIASILRQDPFIDGHQSPSGSLVKLFHYADDTTVVVSPDESRQHPFMLFDRFERASGAKLNGKTDPFWFRPW